MRKTAAMQARSAHRYDGLKRQKCEPLRSPQLLEPCGWLLALNGGFGGSMPESKFRRGRMVGCGWTADVSVLGMVGRDHHRALYENGPRGHRMEARWPRRFGGPDVAFALEKVQYAAAFLAMRMAQRFKLAAGAMQ